MSFDAKVVRREGSPEHGRYSYSFADGSEAELGFSERLPGIVTIIHTETPTRHRGEGIASALVAHAVADFRAAGKTIIPACPFARAQFEAHPEWRDLLARRVE